MQRGLGERSAGPVDVTTEVDAQNLHDFGAVVDM